MPLQLLIIFSFPLLLQHIGSTGYSGRTALITPDQGEVVHIPAGEFIMGSTRRDIAYAVELCQMDSPQLCGRMNFLAETPSHRVRTSAYSIALKEVSNIQYEACVRDGACQPRRDHRPDPRLDAAQLPVVDVSWQDARTYCQWRGGDLPTEAQWERAARGPASRRYPWGNLWNGALCNHGRSISPRHDDSDAYRYAAPVYAFPASRSPYGLINVAGNVWEWVYDWYDDDIYQRDQPVSDPTGPPIGSHRVIRGGSWSSPAFAVRTTFRSRTDESTHSIDLGFRCAWENER